MWSATLGHGETVARGLRAALARGALGAMAAWEQELPREPVVARAAAARVEELVAGGVGRGIRGETMEELLGLLASSSPATLALTGRQLRRSPWVLFFPEAEPGAWVVTRSGLLESLGERALSTRSRSFFSALLQVFVQYYPRTHPRFDAWRATIRDLTLAANGEGLLHVRLQPFISGPVLERNACEQVAALLQSEQSSDAEVLSRIGLWQGLRSGRFGEHLRSALLAQILQRNTDGLVTARELEKVLPLTLETDQTLAPGLRVTAAQALLGPWSTRRAPSDVREISRAFVLQQLGDPRLRDSRWLGVPQREREVLTRWLVEMSFAAFFEILNLTAREEHWGSRSSFWKQYVASGAVVDAWPVFGRSALRIAKRTLEASSFGTLESSGGDPAQSVLLLRVSGPRGSVVVAEFTHNGSCRAWIEGSSSAPSFYKSAYRRPMLTDGADLEKRHAGTATGVWQTHLRGWIRAHTGVTTYSSPRRTAA
jgi:EH_Signature domain